MSAPAIARRVEHIVEQVGKVREAAVLEELQRRGVDEERADEGIRLGLVRGLYVRRTEDRETVFKRQIDLSEAL